MLNWHTDKADVMQKTINAIYEELENLTVSNETANHWIDDRHNVFAMVNDNGDGDEWIEIHYELYDVNEDIIGDLDVINTEDKSPEALIECIKDIVKEYYGERK